MYKIPANTLFMGQKLIYVPECHSTNSLLNELEASSALPEGTVLITDAQTAGRGQRGNVWESQPGLNLTFSILLRPAFLEVKNQFRLNMAVSLAVMSSIQHRFSSRVKLKWPNDIYVDGMKIGGILIENHILANRLSGSIVGIGLNVNQQYFQAPYASSVRNFTGIVHDLDSIFQDLTSSLELEYLDLRAGGVMLKERYLESLYKFNESHRFESGGEDFTGSIYDVDENGRLCVETMGESRTFTFKEVKFLN